MSNETLVTTRRAIMTAVGAVAANALLPFTAFAGRRRRECCTPAATSYCSPCIVIYSAGITAPPSGLVIEEPRGKQISVTGNVPTFSNPNSWATRVIVRVHSTCFNIGNAPTDDTPPSGWFVGALGTTGGAFSVANVVIDNNVPQSNIYWHMGPFWSSVIAQIKNPMMPMWMNIDAGSNSLYGFKA